LTLTPLLRLPWSLMGAQIHHLHTTLAWGALNALALAAFRSDSADSATRDLHITMVAAAACPLDGALLHLNLMHLIHQYRVMMTWATMSTISSVTES
jgi:hypothetical protein